MRRLSSNVVLSLACAAASIGAAHAQFGRGAGDWVTSGNDAQRSSWVRTDPKISRDSMQKPGFQLLWKMNLGTEPNPLTAAVLLDRYIGYRGFRTLGFLGGGSNEIYGVDTDLARVEWRKRFSSAATQQVGSSAGCGATIAVTRPAVVTFPATGGGGFGPGRGGPARGAVGEPDKGAVTLAQIDMPRPAPPPLPRPGVRNAPGAVRPPFGPMVMLLYALTGDGMLHAMYVSNGDEPKPPVRFLPPNAKARGLTVLDDVAYVTTTQGCGGVPNGVWALNLGSTQVASWEAKGGVSGSAGLAFGPDGTLYMSTGDGVLAALDPKTLQVKDSYTSGIEFTSSPVIFQYKEKTLIAAATKDGHIHLLDSKALGDADRNTPLYKTPVYPDSANFVPGALASWQDAAGARWILAPVAGPLRPDSRFTVANGEVTHGAVVAWKVVDQAGAPSLQPGWVSRDIVTPLAPMVVNGVVFAASGGERGQAVMYALDGLSGKELWDSANTIKSSGHGGGLSAGGSQVYLGTSDGALYAFGFPIEH